MRGLLTKEEPYAGKSNLHKVFLSLGSNLGDRQANLRRAISMIDLHIGKVKKESSAIETLPWGYESVHPFINAAIKIESSLSPLSLLHKTQALERILGRTKKTEGGIYEDRIIDIDIILYDNMIITSKELTIPHPDFVFRDFVLKPLAEIEPEGKDPISGKSFRELLENFKR